MVKRKAEGLGEGLSIEEPRRSSRRISKVTTEKPKAKAVDDEPRQSKKRTIKGIEESEREVNGAINIAVKTKPVIHGKKQTESSSNAKLSTPATGRQYWLMKAEPESRFEKGKDIKFSIDDLAAKTVPEPWDGIRAYPARNNLRAMKKGDLAFFYHSSCKIPAIVGIMEIVQEHTPDLSAHDSSAPYYDPKSSPDDPKWSVVHVEFRQKLKTPITLKELKDFQTEKDSELKDMQMLKLTRMSVSKVSEGEWKFLTGIIEKNGEEVFSA